MWKDLGLSGVALLVYARIYGFCKRGGTFFESRRKTAEYLGVSERAVIKSLNKLTEAGLVVEVGEHSLRSGRKTKAFVLCENRPGPTVTDCRSRAVEINPERCSPEQDSRESDYFGERGDLSRLNSVHLAEDSNNKRIEREGLENRFAKYDE